MEKVRQFTDEWWWRTRAMNMFVVCMVWVGLGKRRRVEHVIHMFWQELAERSGFGWEPLQRPGEEGVKLSEGETDL